LYGNVLRIAPPLSITAEEVDLIVDILGGVIDSVSE
jgi:4-aminobutyrate aminotransferase-like enzyme